MSDTINICGYEIEKDWMQDREFPEPPDYVREMSHGEWEMYEERMKEFYERKSKIFERKVLFN